MKKKVILILAAAVLVVALLAGGVSYALFHNTTGSVENTMKIGEPDIEIVEEFDGERKTSIKVQNNGTVPMFVRVKLVSYYVNDEGQFIAKSSPIVSLDCFNYIDWTYDEANDVFYCYEPVLPGEDSPELLSHDIVLKKDAFGSTPVLEVLAQGVQFQPADAIKECWGIGTKDGKIDLPAYKTED